MRKGTRYVLTYTHNTKKHTHWANRHQVREVRKGTRYVLAMWFNCSKEYTAMMIDVMMNVV